MLSTQVEHRHSSLYHDIFTHFATLTFYNAALLLTTNLITMEDDVYQLVRHMIHRFPNTNKPAIAHEMQQWANGDYMWKATLHIQRLQPLLRNYVDGELFECSRQRIYYVQTKFPELLEQLPQHNESSALILADEAAFIARDFADEKRRFCEQVAMFHERLPHLVPLIDARVDNYTFMLEAKAIMPHITFLWALKNSWLIAHSCQLHMSEHIFTNMYNNHLPRHLDFKDLVVYFRALMPFSTSMKTAERVLLS